jgi:hypothetical protein
MARDWNPDMANWAMYTPWPFSDLFQELGDKVEVFDFEKYNFVTPIMKPDAMDRAELLDRVMNNYRRFFMNKSFFQYPWEKDKLRRKYLMGCLKAFLKSGFQRTFYDLGRVGYWGPQSKKKVDFAFDTTHQYEPARPGRCMAAADANWVTMHGPKIEHKRKQGELNARPWPAAAAPTRSPTTACRRPRSWRRSQRGRRPPAGGMTAAAAQRRAHRPNAITRVAEVLPQLLGEAARARCSRRRPAAVTCCQPPQAWSTRPRWRRLHRVLRQQLGTAMPRRWRAAPACAQRLPAGAPHSRGRCSAAEAAASGAAGRPRAAAGHRPQCLDLCRQRQFTAGGRPALRADHPRQPAVPGVQATAPACDFYAATFERLFQPCWCTRPRRWWKWPARPAATAVCRFEIRW